MNIPDKNTIMSLMTKVINSCNESGMRTDESIMVLLATAVNLGKVTMDLQKFLSLFEEIMDMSLQGRLIGDLSNVFNKDSKIDVIAEKEIKGMN